MKKITLIIIGWLSFISNLPAQSMQMAVTSDLNDKSDEALTVDMDSVGNKYVGGYFIEQLVIDGVVYTNTYNTGNGCAYVAKYDALGNVLWVKIMECTWSQVNSLKVNKQTGDCYIEGYFNGDLYINGILQNTAPVALYPFGRSFIIKLDAGGNLIWTNIADSGYGASGYSLALAPNGNSIYVMFDTILPIVFQNGGTFGSGFCYNIARLDASNGNVLTTRSNISDYLVDATLLYCDKSGNLIVAGSHRTAGMSGIDPIFPPVINPTFAIGQGFVWKMDQNLVSIWGKEISGVGSEIVSGIGTDGSDNVFIYGIFDTPTNFDATILTPVAGASNAFVAKISSAGTYVWVDQFSADGAFLNLGNDPEVAFAVDKKGNSYLGGGFGGTLTFGASTITTGVLPVYSSNGFLIKLDKNGTVRWMDQVEGGFSFVTMNSISVQDDDIAICGRYVYNATIDGTTLTSDFLSFYMAGLQDCDIVIETKLVPGTPKLKVPLVAGDSYQWYESGFGAIIGATSNMYKATHHGSYYCLITRGACTIQSTTISLRMAPELLTDTQPQIFPNPAHDHLSILLDDQYSMLSFEVTMVDLMGRVCERGNYMSDANGAVQFDLNPDVMAGTYIIKIAGKQYNCSQTVVVQ